MGTPEFAVASLDALIHSHHQVLAVITAPDSMGGRGGKQLIQSAVKQYALSKNLPILQPEKLRNKEFLKKLKDFNADLFVVVAFRMLPETVWSMPPYGTINVHGSLLPKYRGAAPIHWAIIQGEKESGITIFRLKHEIDTGDIILQEKTSIGENETTGELYQRLMHMGAKDLVTSIDLLESGKVQFISQHEDLSIHAPKIFHEDCEINFDKSKQAIHDFIRGLSPKPTAWMKQQGVKYFISKSSIHSSSHDAYAVGTFYKKDHALLLSCKDGTIEILEIQPEGKRKMSGKDFTNGMTGKS